MQHKPDVINSAIARLAKKEAQQAAQKADKHARRGTKKNQLLPFGGLPGHEQLPRNAQYNPALLLPFITEWAAEATQLQDLLPYSQRQLAQDLFVALYDPQSESRTNGVKQLPIPYRELNPACSRFITLLALLAVFLASCSNDVGPITPIAPTAVAAEVIDAPVEEAPTDEPKPIPVAAPEAATVEATNDTDQVTEDPELHTEPSAQAIPTQEIQEAMNTLGVRPTETISITPLPFQGAVTQRYYLVQDDRNQTYMITATSRTPSSPVTYIAMPLIGIHTYSVSSDQTTVTFFSVEGETVTTYNLTTNEFTPPPLPIETITIQSAPTIEEASIRSMQPDFINQILQAYPEYVTSPTDISVLHIIKAGEGSEARQIDSANLVIYGLKDTGVVLAVYNVESNRLEHAMGGNTYINEQGQTATLPFYILAITKPTVEEKYGAFVGYQNDQMNDIALAQQKLCTMFLLALTLENMQIYDWSQLPIQNVDQIVTLNTQERYQLVFDLLRQYLSIFSTQNTISILGLSVPTNITTIIVNLKYDGKPSNIGARNQFLYKTTTNHALALDLLSAYDPYIEELHLGGTLPRALTNIPDIAIRYVSAASGQSAKGWSTTSTNALSWAIAVSPMTNLPALIENINACLAQQGLPPLSDGSGMPTIDPEGVCNLSDILPPIYILQPLK